MVPSWSQSHNATREYATATRARFTVGSRSHEFHPTLGPKITYQVPEEYISRELFDTVQCPSQNYKTNSSLCHTSYKITTYTNLMFTLNGTR